MGTPPCTFRQVWDNALLLPLVFLLQFGEILHNNFSYQSTLILFQTQVGSGQVSKLYILSNCAAFLSWWLATLDTGAEILMRSQDKVLARD